MRDWGESEKRSVIMFLKRVEDAPVRHLAEEARSLRRYLDPPTELPPAELDETVKGGWIAYEERKARRAAVAEQLKRRHCLSAADISIPGINDRTAKARFLSRCVDDGMLSRSSGRPPKYKLLHPHAY